MAWTCRRKGARCGWNFRNGSGPARSCARCWCGWPPTRGRSNKPVTALNARLMAVRLAVGNDRLAELVRRDEALGSEAETLDKSMMAAVSKDRAKRDPSTEQRARDRLSAIAGERAKLQKALSAEF